MAITPLPTPPSRDDPANFAARGDAFLGALPDFATELNDALPAINDAIPASAAALAAANYKGYWSDLTGALNIPASVSHNDIVWLLQENVANVAAVEPSVSPVWLEIGAGGGGDVIGTLQYFAGTTTTEYPDPATWLECDGAIYSKATYPELSTKLGSVIDGLNSGVAYGNSPVHTTVNGLGYLNSTYLLGVDYGVWTSTNGESWTIRSSAYGFKSIAYGNGMYMGCLDGSSGWTSTDLVTFTTNASTPVYGGNTDITYGNGLFVGCYIFNRLHTSTNGQSWTAVSSNIGNNGSGSVYLTAVDYINGYFFVGSNQGYVSTSQDGTNWSSSGNNANGDQVQGFAYGAGVYVMVCGSSIHTSTNRTTWTQRTNPSANGYYTVHFANSLFVATGYYGVAVSSDGTTWTFYSTGSGNQNLAVTYGSKWLLSGYFGALQSSTDAITWTGKSGDMGMYPRDAVSTSSLSIIVGVGGAVITSTDKINWTARNSGTTSQLMGVTYGASTYAYGGYGGVVRTSTDGTTWTSRTSGTTSSIFIIRYLNDKFVYGGEGAVLATSTDAITWVSRTSAGSSRIVGLAYGNSKYVWVDTSGAFGNSTDGVTWTKLSTGASGALRTVAYGNGIFVAGGDAGYLATSTDGTTWTQRTSGTSTDIYDIAYANTVFFYATNNGIVASSQDGISWSVKPSAVGNGDCAVAGNSTGFLIQGRDGYNLNIPYYSYNTSTQFAVPLQSSVGLSNTTQTLYVKAA